MSLVNRSAIAIACLSTLAVAQKTPNPMNTVPWKPSNANALTLAQQVDASMAKLRGIHGDLVTMIQYDGTGRQVGAIDIADRNTFNILTAFVHYPDIRQIKVNGQTRKQRDTPITGIRFVSNGRLVEQPPISVLPRKIATVDRFRLNTATSVRDWLLGLPRYILGSVRGEAALTSLIKMVARPGSGYKMAVSQRIFLYDRYKLPQYRIIIDRDAANAKKLGPFRLEIMLDASRKLPIEAAAVAMEKNHKPFNVGWLAQWNMRPRVFPASTFKLPTAK